MCERLCTSTIREGSISVYAGECEKNGACVKKYAYINQHEIMFSGQWRKIILLTRAILITSKESNALYTILNLYLGHLAKHTNFINYRKNAEKLEPI